LLPPADKLPLAEQESPATSMRSYVVHRIQVAAAVYSAAKTMPIAELSRLLNLVSRQNRFLV
jgi:hypothetical protein